MTPEISIIIPTYAPGELLWTCLDSLEQQTLGKEAYEVCLVLTRDEEPCFDKIKEHLKNYKMKVSLIYCEHKGVSFARNMGIEFAKGKYLTFIDDDDLVSPNYLEQLSKNSCDNGITVANMIAFRGQVENVADHYLSSAYQQYDVRKKKNIFRHRSLLSSACCKLIPRPLIGDIRFRTNLSHGEDSFFMFMVSAGIKQINVTPPSAIYYIRKRDDSSSRSKENRRKKQKMEIKLFYFYTKEYFSHIKKYNLLFYVSRIVATAYKLFLEDYVRPL